MREKTACFTGHREIPKNDMRKIRQNTLNAIIKAYENGYRYFGSGVYLFFPAADKPNTGRIKKYGNTIK